MLVQGDTLTEVLLERGDLACADKSQRSFLDLLPAEHDGDRRAFIRDHNLSGAFELDTGDIMESSDDIVFAYVSRDFDLAVFVRLIAREPALHALEVF
jgi:hypothetical protein